MRTRHAFAALATLMCASAAPTAWADGDDEGEAPWVLKGKFGDGVTFESADGKTGLNLGARAQLRGTGTIVDDRASESGVDAQVRRLRLTLEGHTFGETLSFKIQLAAATLDVDPEAPSVVRDAFVTWAPLRDLRFRVGQAKVPFGRQRLVSSGRLQLVDRSIANGELSLDRDVGLFAFSNDLGGLDRWIGYAIGVFGGDGRNRIAEGSGVLLAARFEVRPAGGGVKTDDGEADLTRSPRPRMTIGVSAATNRRSDRERSTVGGIYETGPWADYLHAGGDYVLMYRGLSLSGEVWVREAEEDEHVRVIDEELVTDRARTGWGGYVQAGQMIGPMVEVIGRYGGTLPLGPPGGGVVPRIEAGGGVSVYVVGHALKLQSDLFRIVSLEPAVTPHETVARLQVQIAP